MLPNLSGAPFVVSPPPACGFVGSPAAPSQAAPPCSQVQLEREGGGGGRKRGRGERGGGERGKGRRKVRKLLVVSRTGQV